MVMGNDPILISSVSEYLSKINELIKLNPNAQLIYRGQDRFFEPFKNGNDSNIRRFIKSGATRRLQEYLRNEDISNENLLYYTIFLINYSKKKRYHIGLKNLELISELQHFGAATILIDFTKSALIALYFACAFQQENDGCVFVMNKSNTKLFKEADLEDFDNDTKQEQNKLTIYFSDVEPRMLYFWEPSSLNMRIPAQHSIFVFGWPEISTMNVFVSIIKINNKSKKDILKELKSTYDIDDITLFNDLPGFAYANRSDSRIDEEYYKSEQVKELLVNIYDNEKQSYNNEIRQLENNNDIDSNKKLSELYYKKGWIAYNGDNLIEAERLFKVSIEKDNSNYNAFYYLGNIYREQEKFQIAIDNYNKALELNEKLEEALVNRGVAHFKLEDILSAINDYNEAIKLNPHDYKAYFNRGDCYINQGILKKANEDYTKAIDDYTKVIELKPNDSEAYNNRGVAYEAQDKLAKAIKDYTKAIDLNPHYIKAYNNRGSAYQKKGKIKKAEADFKKADEEYFETL